jgi:hypothetical protein
VIFFQTDEAILLMPPGGHQQNLHASVQLKKLNRFFFQRGSNFADVPGDISKISVRLPNLLGFFSNAQAILPMSPGGRQQNQRASAQLLQGFFPTRWQFC